MIFNKPNIDKFTTKFSKFAAKLLRLVFKLMPLNSPTYKNTLKTICDRIAKFVDIV